MEDITMKIKLLLISFICAAPLQSMDNLQKTLEESIKQIEKAFTPKPNLDNFPEAKELVKNLTKKLIEVNTAIDKAKLPNGAQIKTEFIKAVSTNITQSINTFKNEYLEPTLKETQRKNSITPSSMVVDAIKEQILNWLKGDIKVNLNARDKFNQIKEEPTKYDSVLVSLVEWWDGTPTDKDRGNSKKFIQALSDKNTSTLSDILMKLQEYFDLLTHQSFQAPNIYNFVRSQLKESKLYKDVIL